MNGRASPFAAGTILHLHGAELATSGTPLACPDWSIAAGDAWFVAGGAGTGKTTLLRAIAGLESPAAGRIEFLGADWANLSEGAGLDYRRRIGIVLCQGAGLFHQFTVLENIELPLRYHGGLSSGQVRDRARALMAALKLERFSDAPSVRLPPGVARRVQLARALAMDPEVLLLDDPCSQLDDRDRRRLLHLLRQLHTGHELNEGRAVTVIAAGAAPGEWEQFPGMKWALIEQRRLTLKGSFEQLVASAPELFQHADADVSGP